jgi:hypothetical protein
VVAGMAQPLPVEILFGIYLGVLTGVFPALVSWGLGFLFKYVTGVSIPAFGVVVLALALAGINGGLLALNDPAVVGSGFRVVVALIVVSMVSMYAHARGDRMGAEFPRRLSLSKLRDRTLSNEVVELVGSRGEVHVEVTGEVVDMEGYPPLSAATREAIRTGEWRFPADLPLSELETRFEDRLRTELDLADVSATIDERGTATVVAAPPLSGVSKRVPSGKRAVSVETLVPTGLARGDEVTLSAGGVSVDGTVVAARTGAASGRTATTDGGTPAEPAPPVAAPTTTGGEGRLTVAVARADAETLLGVDRPTVVVTARGTRREYELLSLLRRAGKRFRKVTVRQTSGLVGTRLGDADLRNAHAVAVLGVERPDGWLVAPDGDVELRAGDELFVVGTAQALDAFEEVLA